MTLGGTTVRPLGRQIMGAMYSYERTDTIAEVVDRMGRNTGAKDDTLEFCQVVGCRSDVRGAKHRY